MSMRSLVARAVRVAILVAATAAAHQGPLATAQEGFYAGIAYSQSTGKIGYTARQARTEEAARQLAARHCGVADAKTYIWGPDQWVAIAIVDGKVGIAGFGRGASADVAQSRALEECGKRAHGAACRVALCIHSQGMRARQLRSTAADPKLAKASRFFAAIAYSPSTGKVGYTTGKALTKEEAQQLALKDCGARDAKAFMWGREWVAVAVCDSRRGVAGFAPGATREVAEKQALTQCSKLAQGAPCRIALVVHSSTPPKDDAGSDQPAGNSVGPTATRSVVTPAAASSEAASTAPSVERPPNP